MYIHLELLGVVHHRDQLLQAITPPHLVSGLARHLLPHTVADGIECLHLALKLLHPAISAQRRLERPRHSAVGREQRIAPATVRSVPAGHRRQHAGTHCNSHQRLARPPDAGHSSKVVNARAWGNL